MNNENSHQQISQNSEQPSKVNSSEAQSASQTQPAEKQSKFKKIFFQVLIVCLISAATIAVIAVLTGGFNDILGKSLATILLVALHASFSFSYISEVERQDLKDGGRSHELFSNTVFVLIVASFITSIFATWGLLSGNLTLRLYMSYVVLLFATLHADVLFRIRNFENKINTIVTANYIIMSFVVIMMFIFIFTNNSATLGDMYYRILAAFGIIDATLTLIAIIMHRLFLQKHPSSVPQSSTNKAAQSQHFWKNPLVIILFIFLAFQLLGGIMTLLFQITN